MEGFSPLRTCVINSSRLTLLTDPPSSYISDAGGSKGATFHVSLSVSAFIARNQPPSLEKSVLTRGAAPHEGQGDTCRDEERKGTFFSHVYELLTSWVTWKQGKGRGKKQGGVAFTIQCSNDGRGTSPSPK